GFERCALLLYGSNPGDSSEFHCRSFSDRRPNLVLAGSPAFLTCRSEPLQSTEPPFRALSFDLINRPLLSPQQSPARTLFVSRLRAINVIRSLGILLSNAPQ